jgi:hypothetical protein
MVVPIGANAVSGGFSGRILGRAVPALKRFFARNDFLFMFYPFVKAHVFDLNFKDSSDLECEIPANEAVSDPCRGQIFRHHRILETSKSGSQKKLGKRPRRPVSRARREVMFVLRSH